MIARSLIPQLSTVIGILMLVPLTGHAAWSLPDDKQTADFETATALTSPVEVRKAAGQFAVESPLRFLLLGRSASIEGAHARAIRFLETAVRMMESDKQGGDAAKSARWHAYGLYWLARCLLDAGKDREQIEVLAKYRSAGHAGFEEINQIKVPAAYFEVLALLKRGDVALAGKILALAREGGGKTPPLSRMDCAQLDLELKEAEGMDVAELLKVNASAVEAQRAKGEEVDSGLLSTLAYYALRNGDFGTARQAFEECAKRVDAQTTYHPYRSLAEMELAAGHWQEADCMLENCWKWQKTKRAGVRQELEKETLLTVANGYLARGYPEDAWRVVQPLLENGVRGGFRSSRPEKWEAGLCLTAITALRMKSENAWDSGLDGTQRVLIEARLRACIARHLANNQRKMSFEDLVDCPDWLWGELFRCLGPALAEHVIAAYPPTGTLASAKIAAASLEVARQRGKHRLMLELAQKALDGLPADCALLRTRILTAQAEALWSLGQRENALACYEAVLTEGPSMIPISGTRLPVSYDGKVDSHFMRLDSAGFRLRSNANAKQVTWILDGPSGKVIREVITSIRNTGDSALPESIFRPDKPMTTELMNLLEGR
jgi:tetratricopeptide (TPR) repeat protein